MMVQTNRAKWQVLECRDHTDLERLYRFRYAEYVEKMGLFQKIADHKNQRLTDPSDTFGVNFLAESAGEVIGSIRMNDFKQFVHTFCVAEIDIREIDPDIFKKGCLLARAMVAADWRSTPVFADLALTVAKRMRHENLRWLLVFSPSWHEFGEEDRYISMYQSMGFKIWRHYEDPNGHGSGKLMLLDLEEEMANPKTLACAYLQ